MKEQDKTPERNLNEMEINNLPAKEFKAVVKRTITKLRKGIEEHSENFKKRARKYTIELMRAEIYKN